MAKGTQEIICTAFANGKCHDFRLFKESRTHIHKNALVKTDTGSLGIANIHSNSELPYKKSKNHPLIKKEKRYNRKIASDRVTNEHTIGFIKRFRILSERYRNRRKRFSLRFN